MTIPKTDAEMMQAALLAAHPHLGQASPNPPVGAAGFDAQGNLLAACAHLQAGLPHAEALVIAACKQAGTLDRLHSMAVTLSPCTHHGRTPPCADAILATLCRHVVIGVRDENPAANGGAAKLQQAGLSVRQNVLPIECLHQLGAFQHRIKYKRPFVTIKLAINAQNSLVPPVGQKTFTSPNALQLAHMMRKKADAIITGSGTVLADNPAFTVRHVADFANKTRPVYVCDRHGYLTGKTLFQLCRDWQFALNHAAENGALEVLVEAGGRLCASILEQNAWDLLVVIKQQPDGSEQVFTQLRQQEMLADSNFNLYRWLPYEAAHTRFAINPDSQLADDVREVCHSGLHA